MELLCRGALEPCSSRTSLRQAGAHHGAALPAGTAQGLGPAEALSVSEELWHRVKEF